MITVGTKDLSEVLLVTDEMTEHGWQHKGGSKYDGALTDWMAEEIHNDLIVRYRGNKSDDL